MKRGERVGLSRETRGRDKRHAGISFIPPATTKSRAWLLQPVGRGQRHGSEVAHALFCRNLSCLS